MASTGGTVSELAGEPTYDSQQLLWQKQVTLTDFVDFDSGIDQYQTGIVQFCNAERQRQRLTNVIIVRRNLFFVFVLFCFAQTSFFFVAAGAYSRLLCDFFSLFSVANVE